MHPVTGNWRLGLVLSLITALMWGMLPIALKLLLPVMDAVTITWYRFVAAGLLLGAYLLMSRKLPARSGLSGTGWKLLLVCVAGLCGNYLLYLLGLRLTSPAAAQIVIQLAPAFLLLGGVWIYGETFRIRQWAGFAILLSGLLLFFHDRIDALSSGSGDESLGVALIVLSAIFWAGYALAQKQLLARYSSNAIMWMIYLCAALLLIPVSVPRQVLALDGFGWFLLIFSSLNTLVAYGCFAEALNHWQASRISAVLAITPLVTLAATVILGRLYDGIVYSRADSLSLLGACIVVAGSIAIVTPAKADGKTRSMSNETKLS
jgi:drug/metabolite transporter (DMT)-like permease